MKLSRLASAVASVGVAIASMGCGGAGANCDVICECQNPDSDRRFDDCVENCELAAEDAADIADNHGCGDAYDQLVACIDDTGECRTSSRFYETRCRSEAEDLQRCL